MRGRQRKGSSLEHPQSPVLALLSSVGGQGFSLWPHGLLLCVPTHTAGSKSGLGAQDAPQTALPALATSPSTAAKISIALGITLPRPALPSTLARPKPLGLPGGHTLSSEQRQRSPDAHPQGLLLTSVNSPTWCFRLSQRSVPAGVCSRAHALALQAQVRR